MAITSTNILNTDANRVDAALMFANSFSDPASSYYLFMGDCGTHSNTAIQTPNNDVNDSYYGVWAYLIQGKKVANTNVILAIRNVPYVANVIYSMYDDSDVAISTEDYYVTVNAGSWYHTFKCLDNNQGVASTVTPDFTQIVGADINLYQTADGYRWKYLFSVDNNTVAQMGTVDFFPFVANTSTAAAAVPGSIDIIAVITGGNFYNNYIPSGIFLGSDLAIGNNITYGLSNNPFVVPTSGFYTDCIIYMITGVAAGEYRTVIDFQANSFGNFIILDNPFDSPPTNGDQYEIYPQVQVAGSGHETVNCIGRALVNSTGSNSIYRIEILERGQDYTQAVAFVIANSVVAANTALIRPILPPPGGHGADAAKELQAYNVVVSLQTANTEGGTMLAQGSFQQIGLLKNPTFANVHLTLAGPLGEFVPGETIYVVNAQPIVGGCSANTLNPSILGTNTTLFTSQFQPGQNIILGDASLNYLQYASVASVPNNSLMLLSVNALATSNSVLIYYPNVTDTMVCNTVVSSTEIAVETQGHFDTTSFLLGGSSMTFSGVGAISHNDVVKPFANFIQARPLNISMIIGTFIPGEQISQNNSIATLYSANSSMAWISEQFGQFTTLNITGNTSGAVASVAAVYDPELVFGEGDILYLENLDSITRQPDQTETFKLTFCF